MKPDELQDILDMECPPFSGSAFCSDDDCPCDNTKMPPAQGYLWIKQSVVDTRKECLSLTELQEHLLRGGVAATDIAILREKYVPLAICAEGAKLRGLDLETAAKDFTQWVIKGTVPCRPTPLAQHYYSEKGIKALESNIVNISDTANEDLNVDNPDYIDPNSPGDQNFGFNPGAAFLTFFWLIAHGRGGIAAILFIINFILNGIARSIRGGFIFVLVVQMIASIAFGIIGNKISADYNHLSYKSDVRKKEKLWYIFGTLFGLLELLFLFFTLTLR